MSLGRDLKLPLREITVRTSRSSGPGGQHANVTASRVEAIFDVEASDALTPRRHRRATRPTSASVERRLDVKRRQAARKRERRRPRTDDP